MQPVSNTSHSASSPLYVPAAAAASIATALGQEVLRSLASSEAPPSIKLRLVTKASHNYNDKDHFIAAKKLALFRQYDRAWHCLKNEAYTDPESHHLLGIIFLNLYARSQDPEELEKAFYHWEIAESTDFEGAPILAAVDLLINSHLRPEPFTGEDHEVLLDHWYSGTIRELRKFKLFELIEKSPEINEDPLFQYMDALATKVKATRGHPLLLASQEISILNELCIRKLASLDLPRQASAAKNDDEKRVIWNLSKPLYLMISLALLMKYPEPIVTRTDSRSRPFKVRDEITGEDKSFMKLVGKIEVSPMKDVLKYGDNVLQTTLKIIGIMFSPEKYTAVFKKYLKANKQI